MYSTYVCLMCMCAPFLYEHIFFSPPDVLKQSFLSSLTANITQLNSPSTRASPTKKIFLRLQRRTTYELWYIYTRSVAVVLARMADTWVGWASNRMSAIT